MLTQDVLDLYISAVKHVDHGKISRSAFIGGVAANGSGKQIHGLLRESKFVHLNLGLPRLNWNLNVTASPHAYDLHLVVGKGTCLIRADVVCTAHDFARGKLLDIAIILEHCADRESERYHNGKRKSLWYCHYNDDDSDDEELKPLANILEEAAIVRAAHRVFITGLQCFACSRNFLFLRRGKSWLRALASWCWGGRRLETSTIRSVFFDCALGLVPLPLVDIDRHRLGAKQVDVSEEEALNNKSNH